MTEVRLQYSYATSPRNSTEALKGIVYYAHFDTDAVFAHARFARGLSHPRLFDQYSGSPSLDIYASGGEPDFNGVAVYSHHDFTKPPEVYAFGVNGTRELRGSKNPERVRHLGLALGGVSHTLMNLNRLWASGERIFSAEDLAELEARINFY